MDNVLLFFKRLISRLKPSLIEQPAREATNSYLDVAVPTIYQQYWKDSKILVDFYFLKCLLFQAQNGTFEHNYSKLDLIYTVNHLHYDTKSSHITTVQNHHPSTTLKLPNQIESPHKLKLKI